MSQDFKPSCSVVVVDDDFADDFKMSLDEWTTGSVRAAEDGMYALHLIEQEIPDVVVTDGRMPRMGGLELTGKIRENPAHSHVKIIMVSGEAGFKAPFLQTGGDLFLPKPFEPKELQQAILQVLQAPTVAPSPSQPCP